jgi:pyruvate kinase
MSQKKFTHLASMRRSRQTKIVATVGPGSATEEVLANLYHAGADVFRFNFSHGTHEEHLKRLEIVRAVEAKVGRPIDVFADLQGPKLRVGQFADGTVILEAGSNFRLDLSEERGSAHRAHLPHPEVFAALRVGSTLLLDDGKVQLEEIVDLTDSVMVARGDLGVELPPEMVPAIQKRIIRTWRQAGKPVVIATQMLDSMVTATTPTRAEASDVANAVYEGADAVMLSAETAVGEHPVRVVDMMDRIIKQTESDPAYPELLNAGQAKPRRTTADTITESARQAAITLPAVAIVTFTTSGATALRAACNRPPVPILALIPSVQIARSLALVWGIHAIEVATPE